MTLTHIFAGLIGAMIGFFLGLLWSAINIADEFACDPIHDEGSSDSAGERR